MAREKRKGQGIKAQRKQKLKREKNGMMKKMRVIRICDDEEQEEQKNG